jgi:hypothetical protein
MMRSGGLACVLAWGLHGCMGAPACTEAGNASLIIPVTRLASVAGLRTDGPCTVGALPADCSGATWCGEWRGEQVVVVPVTGNARGKCTVSVDFNDGCTSETRSYEFMGSHDNCCEAICAKPLPWDALASRCGG